MSRITRTDSLESALKNFSARFSLDEEMKQLAEQVRLAAIDELQSSADECPEKQRLINSLTVVKGAAQGEYLVQSTGEYGEELEFGSKESTESPWLIPAFVTVRGLIHTCQHGALSKALLKARRPHKG